jgi:hypothetical protein
MWGRIFPCMHWTLRPEFAYFDMAANNVSKKISKFSLFTGMARLDALSRPLVCHLIVVLNHKVTSSENFHLFLQALGRPGSDHLKILSCSNLTVVEMFLSLKSFCCSSKCCGYTRFQFVWARRTRFCKTLLSTMSPTREPSLRDR